MKLNSNCVT